MITRRLILFAPDPPNKPTAAPAPAASAPAAPPAPEPSQGPADEPHNPFADLDAKFAAAGTPPPAPKAGDTPPKPVSGEPKAPVAPAQPSPKPAAPTEPTRTPKELRDELARTKSEFETHKAGTAQLEKKIADYEKRGKDTDALRARLEARDKEYDELQSQLHALRFETTSDFKARYDKPFDRAAAYAQHILSGINKVDGAKADFDKDFIPLYRMSPNKAYAAAEELFGEDAAKPIMQQVVKLQELDFERRQALEEEKSQWQSKQKEEQGKIVQQREQFQDAWVKANTDLQKTVPEYQDPVDDTELSGLRQEGYGIFDAETKTPRELLWKNAHIRHRTAAFGPNQLLLKRKDARIAELEAELAKHKPRQPNPNPSKPGGKETAAPEEDWATGAIKAVQGA